MGAQKKLIFGATAGALMLAGVSWFALRPTPVQAEGIEWSQASLDEALAQAGESGGRVFIKFDADWCTYCQHLEEEVLATAEGGALTRDMVALRLDFDAPENRALVERFVILGLPTVLVLTAEGTQVGRVQGYHGREAWLEEARAAVIAEDPIPALRIRATESPDDPAVARELGEALLVRGYPEEGEALLERVIFMEGETAAEPAADALFLLGRYHHRVRQNPRVARHYWRELANRFPESDYRAGAYWWFARAEHELGRGAQGLAVLDYHARQHPGDADATALLAQYLQAHEEVDADRADVAVRLRGLLARIEDEEERQEIEQLADSLTTPQ